MSGEEEDSMLWKIFKGMILLALQWFGIALLP